MITSLFISISQGKSRNNYFILTYPAAEIIREIDLISPQKFTQMRISISERLFWRGYGGTNGGNSRHFLHSYSTFLPMFATRLMAVRCGANCIFILDCDNPQSVRVIFWCAGWHICWSWSSRRIRGRDLVEASTSRVPRSDPTCEIRISGDFYPKMALNRISN